MPNKKCVTRYPNPDPFYPNAEPGRVVRMECICAPSESNCTQEYINELLELIANYTKYITNGKPRQLELIDKIEQAKKDVKIWEDSVKSHLDSSAVAMQWYELYTTVQNDFKTLTRGLGCYAITDLIGGTKNDAIDAIFNESFQLLVGKFLQQAIKLRTAQITVYGVSAAVATLITTHAKAAYSLYAGAVGIVGLVGFCTGIDIGRGTCYTTAGLFKKLADDNLAVLRNKKYNLELLEKEKKKLDTDMGNWYRNKLLSEETLKHCLGLDIKLIPNLIAVLKLQALPCKTIKENLKISINKIKKFHSKKLKLESDKDFGNKTKNSYQETIPLFKFEIKKLKGYRDRYYSNKKDNLVYVSLQANIEYYEKIILLYQRLLKNVNYKRMKYAKELKLASEDYILEKQNYKDLTKQLLNNCMP